MTLGLSRKLTTIFCGDVLSDTSFAANGQEALAALEQGRKTMRRLIEARKGRVIDSGGEETVAEFASVVEAVRTAVDIQSEPGSKDAGRPGHPQICFRIGINLGDVMVDGDDIYGDGVNIAARLLSLASPDGILISSTVHDQVHNKLGVGFDFMGRIGMKNIDGGIAGYLVRIGPDVEEEASPPPDPKPAQPAALRATMTGSAAPIDLTVMSITFAAINLTLWERNFWGPLAAAFPGRPSCLSRHAKAMPHRSRPVSARHRRCCRDCDQSLCLARRVLGIAAGRRIGDHCRISLGHAPILVPRSMKAAACRCHERWSRYGERPARPSSRPLDGVQEDNFAIRIRQAAATRPISRSGLSQNVFEDAPASVWT
jgi:class 3 adenylate cyclase